MVLRPHRSRLCPNKSVSPGHDGSDFFINLHLIISRLLTYLWSFATRLPSYPYRPAPRPATLDTMGGEAGGCGVLSVLRFDFLPPASFPLCLLTSGRSRPRSSLSSHDVDGGGRLVICRLGVLPACLPRRIRAVPPLIALSFHFMARSIGAALCRALMLWVRVRGLPCPAVCHPVLPDCLR